MPEIIDISDFSESRIGNIDCNLIEITLDTEPDQKWKDFFSNNFDLAKSVYSPPVNHDYKNNVIEIYVRRSFNNRNEFEDIYRELIKRANEGQ